MKILLFIPIFSILLAGCTGTAAKPLFAAPTPAQVTQGTAIVEPIADAAAAAAGYGAFIPAANALWGMMEMAYAGQPIASGATTPAIGSAILAAIPAGTSAPVIAAALQQAAALLQSKAATESSRSNPELRLPRISTKCRLSVSGSRSGN